MKKLIVLCSIVLTLLSLISGCAPHPELDLGRKTRVGIMVPSDTVEAGTGILVFGETEPLIHRLLNAFDCTEAPCVLL